MFNIAGKTAVVTGGGRGIGLMIARVLVHSGVKVYISSRDAKACGEAAEALNKLGPGTCVAVPQDLSTSDGVAGLVTAVTKAEGKLNILVNNSGVSWGAPFEKYVFT